MTKATWLLAAGLLTLVGCDRPGGTTVSHSTQRRVGGDDKTTVEESTTVTRTEKEAYQKEMQANLQALDKEMAHWREKLDQASADAKQSMQQQLKVLEEKRAIVAERLRELGTAGNAAWVEVRHGLNSAYEDLKAAAQKAREKFR